MAEEKDLKNAQAVYKTLCDILDKIEWKYEKHPEDLVITFTSRGDDLPMNFIMAIDPERDLIRLLSPLPSVFPEELRLEGAIATSQINYGLADGSFDYDYKKGRVVFRMTSSYKSSLISEAVFLYMVHCACYTVDKYNDKLYLVSIGKLDFAKFVSEL